MAIIAIIGGTFVAGALAGVLVVICVGIAREDRRGGSLPGRAPTPLTAGARRMAGLTVHVPSTAVSAGYAPRRQAVR
jgi:hypothetical protein